MKDALARAWNATPAEGDLELPPLDTLVRQKYANRALERRGIGRLRREGHTAPRAMRDAVFGGCLLLTTYSQNLNFSTICMFRGGRTLVTAPKPVRFVGLARFVIVGFVRLANTALSATSLNCV